VKFQVSQVSLPSGARCFTQPEGFSFPHTSMDFRPDRVRVRRAFLGVLTKSLRSEGLGYSVLT
jgi:hypothetical protein